MNHLNKMIVIIFAIHGVCIFAMDDPSRVPSLQDICIARIAPNIFRSVDQAVENDIATLRNGGLCTEENIERTIKNELVSATKHLPDTCADHVIEQWIKRFTWKMKPERQVLHFYPATGAYEIAWNHTGNLLASSADGSAKVTIWSYENGDFSIAQEFDSAGRGLSSLAWHPSKNVLACGMAASEIEVWEQNKEGLFICAHMFSHNDIGGYSPYITSLAWHPRDDMLVAGTFFSGAQLWKKNDRGRFEYKDTYCDCIVYSQTKVSVSWDLNDDIVAIANELGVKLLQVDDEGTLKFKETLKNFLMYHHVRIRCSPDHTAFVTGSSTGEVQFYKKQDNRSWECDQSMSEHVSQIASLSWHPNSSVLASSAWDKTVRIWVKDEHGQFTCEQVFNRDKLVHSLTWHPSEDALAIGHVRGALSVYDFTPTFSKIAAYLLAQQSVLGKRQRSAS